MSEKPSSIRNLGPASDTFYARAGITTAQELQIVHYRAIRTSDRTLFNCHRL